MKYLINTLNIILFCSTIQGQPLFRLKTSQGFDTNANGFNLSSERYVICHSDSNGVKIIPLIDDSFNSYLWEFGDGTTSTLFNPQKHHYQNTGDYNIKLTVTKNTPFTIMSNLSLIQTNNSWEPQCSDIESEPDFYYEYYDETGQMIYQTPKFGNTPVPINQTISGVLTKKPFKIEVYEEDKFTLFCFDASDEFMGKVNFPVNFNHGVYEDSENSLKFSVTVSSTNTTSFILPVRVYAAVNPKPIITNINNCLISDVSGNWINENFEIISYNTDTICPLLSGSYRVTNGTANCTRVSDPYHLTITGVEEIGNDFSVFVYPNPTQGNVKVRFLQPMNNIKVIIFNELGQYIQEASAQNESEINIDLVNFTSGIYFGRVMLSEKQLNFKIILK